MNFRKLTLVVYTCIFCSFAHATVNWSPAGGGWGITLSGEITQADVRGMETALRETKGGALRTVSVASSGGDVDAALKIGNMIYQADLNKPIQNKQGKKRTVSLATPVIVTGEGCASACVLILASAKARVVFGPVVIHNPYLTDTNLGYDEIKKHSAAIKRRAIEQMSRVGVSEELWGLMTTVPSHEGKVMSEAELQRLGLDGRDPAYEDYMNGASAFMAGLDKSEYLSRKSIEMDCLRANPGNAEYCSKKAGL